MGIVFNFPENEYSEDKNLQKERDEEFYSAAKVMNEFIRSLPLSKEDNDRLIDLVVEQIRLAECGAYSRGMKLGAIIAREHPGEEI